MPPNRVNEPLMTRLHFDVNAHLDSSLLSNKDSPDLTCPFPDSQSLAMTDCCGSCNDLVFVD